MDIRNLDFSMIFNWTFFALFLALLLTVVASKAISKFLMFVRDPEDVLTVLDVRYISRASRNGLERAFSTIVEEMALAASLPVPKVCIIDLDIGINSFVIGSNANDTIIGVTQGLLECLNRQEMQAVVAHELGKILNGDLRKDLKILSVVSSLNAISGVGEVMYSQSDQHRSYIITAVGYLIAFIGSPGVIISSFIKAFLCRKNVIFADEIAVKMTNNPKALASVLKKIGALRFRSKYGILNELSVLFFSGNSCPRHDSRSPAHPSIKTRIYKLDPDWNGEFPQIRRLKLSNFKSETANSLLAPACQEMPDSPEACEHLIAIYGGDDDNAKIILSREILSEIPDAIIEKLRNPNTVRALLMAMLLDKNPQIEKLQMQALLDHSDESLYKEVITARLLLKYIKEDHYVLMIRIANPVLRSLPKKLFEEFTQLLKVLIMMDQKITLFEYCMYEILIPNKSSKVTNMTYAEASAVITRSLKDESFTYLNVDRAVKTLAKAEVKTKRILINELLEQISKDGVVSTFEEQYISAVCCAIGLDLLSN